MNPARTEPKPTEAHRRRLYADHLCYLQEGAQGLQRRHGMQRAVPGWADEYDQQAAMDLQPASEGTA